MRNFFSRLMAGRYGSDSLSRFLSVVAIIVVLASMFTRGIASIVLWFAAIAMLIYLYFRMFSRNFTKRYAENEKYTRLKSRFLGWFRQRKDMAKQRGTHCFFRCPSCRSMMRVPKGKGKVQIRCTKCGTAFVRKT